MAWSGGSITFSPPSGATSYNVTYNAPTYSNPPSGYVVTSGPYVKTAGPSTVAASTYVSQTYEVEYMKTTAPYTLQYSTKTISATSPAAPVVITYPSASISITGYSSNTITYSWTSSYGSGTAPAYTIVNFPDGASSSAQSGTYTATNLNTPGQTYVATITASSYFSTFGENLVSSTSVSKTKASSPIFSDTTLAQAMVNVSYSDSVSASGSNSYSAVVTSGNFGGLGFGSNGTVTGTPTTAGTVVLQVTANNQPSDYMPTSNSTSVSLQIINASPMVYNTGTNSWVRSQGVYVYNGTQWTIAQMQVRNSGNTAWSPPG